MSQVIFIDCTHTYHTNVNSGIQRVVRNIVRNSEAVSKDLNYHVQPVIFGSDNYYPVGTERILTIEDVLPPKTTLKQRLLTFYHSLQNFIAALIPYKPIKNFITAPKEYFGLSWLLGLPYRLLIRKKSIIRDEETPHDLDSYEDQKDNILLLLDFAADINIWPAVHRFRKKSGKVITVVYDLIPLNHPETTADYLYGPFKKWLDNSINHSDKIVTISKFVAKEVEEYIRQNHQKTIPIEHFYLGSELDLVSNSRPNPEFTQIFKNQNTFISVGSIEPRKNHKYILDAFDKIWEGNFNATLIIIGKHGWKNEDLINRIVNHKEFNKKLFLVRNASDNDLSFAYNNARALIFSSIVEGFGLPIVEAFQKGLMVMCSDIPVFREIAEGKAVFFDLNSPESLSNEIREYSRKTVNPNKDYCWLNWKESTEQLFKAAINL